jgi:hypothetical protein
VEPINKQQLSALWYDSLFFIMKRPRVVELHVCHDDEEFQINFVGQARWLSREPGGRAVLTRLRKFVATAD